mmetsp:Transcript_9179/g.21042  ORF Transcript_9179/g.21042 Transcript_9179/m.21042 type:complete len:238 (-) Transcript_9179:35-748(-)
MLIEFYDDDYKCWFGLIREKNIKFQNVMKTDKTGTTIVGICLKDNVILAADTRSTRGKFSNDNFCKKIHFLANNIGCCGAGTSADIQNIIKYLKINTNFLNLEKLNESKLEEYVKMAQDILYNYKGVISAALIIGGFDYYGFNLYSIYPNGSAEKNFFASMGSGSFASIGILEKNYSEKMTLKSAINLSKQSIMAGIYNDLGSGGSVDIYVISRDQNKLYRNLNVNVRTMFYNTKVF